MNLVSNSKDQNVALNDISVPLTFKKGVNQRYALKSNSSNEQIKSEGEDEVVNEEEDRTARIVDVDQIKLKELPQDMLGLDRKINKSAIDLKREPQKVALKAARAQLRRQIL